MPVGERHIDIAITSDGMKALIPNYLSNTVSIINTPTDQVIATVDVGIAPLSVAITPDGAKAYVANSISESVSVIDIEKNKVVKTTDLSPESSIKK